MDYDILEFEERKKLVESVLEDQDAFFVEYFDERFKVELNKVDKLSLDDRECREIEKMATYLLNSGDLEDDNRDIEHNIFTNSKLFEKRIKERASGLYYQDSNLDFLLEKRNFNIEKKQKLESKECKTGVLENYQRLKLDIMDKMKTVDVPERFKLKNICREIKTDQLIYKDRGVIYFKHVMNGGAEPDYFLFNFGDISHVRALLKFSGGKLNEWLGILVHDLMGLLERVDLGEKEKEILRLWREQDSTQESIGEEIGCSQQWVSKCLDGIAGKVVKEYLESKEDWIYREYLRGEYKKCSRCGEIKLISGFDVDKSKSSGYKSACKKCRGQK